MTPIRQLDIDITVHLGNTVLRPSLRIAASGITAVFGPSGSGKTSLINAIAGLLTPVAGHIVVGEARFFDHARKINVPAERRHIGYVFQDGRLFPHLSVAGNLDYGQRHRRHRAAVFGDGVHRSSPSIVRDEVVELLALAPLLARRPIHLSGGERQRVALGRAILSAPGLLLLDEPLSSLDAARKNDIVPYLIALRDRLNLPMLLVTHSIEEVMRLADNLVLLRDGSVIGCGTVSAVLPAAGAEEFSRGTLIDAVLIDWDGGSGVVDLGGAQLRLTLSKRPIGTRVRLWISADDVVFTKVDVVTGARVEPLRVMIERVDMKADNQALVHARAGSANIFAELPCAALERVGIAPGGACMVHIRPVVLD